jgi:hypothetical protein
MKKIIGIAAIAAMVATSAFADISFGAWGRGVWYAAANAQDSNGNDEIVTGMGQAWGGDSPRVGLSAHGSSDNAGFNLDYYGNGASTGAGDNVNLWVKPVSQFKIMMGKFDDNPLRGDAAWGLWNWKRVGAVGSMGEGFTFPGQGSTGVQLAVFPVEGLSAYVVLPLNTSVMDSDDLNTDTAVATELGHKASYFAAYAIKDIGTIKAGVQCQDQAYDKDYKKVDYALVDGAFDLTAVKNLFVSVGAFIPTAQVYTATYTAATKDVYGWFDKDDNPETADTWEIVTAAKAESYTHGAKVTPKVNAYVRYTFDALTLHVAAGSKFNEIDKSDTKTKRGDESNLGLAFGFGADYAFANNIGLFADVRYANAIYESATTADNSDVLSLGAGVSKGFSNGSIGVGFAGATNGGVTNTDKDITAKGIYGVAKDAFSWAIPVKVEMSF